MLYFEFFDRTNSKLKNLVDSNSRKSEMWFYVIQFEPRFAVNVANDHIC